MIQTLVTKAQTYAAKQGGGVIANYKEIGLLATGAVAFFTEKNELITAANAATIDADRKRFYIAVGNAIDASGVLKSSMIPRLGTNVEQIAYAASVKPIKFIGADGTTAGTALNIPTVVAGDEYSIKIIDTTTPYFTPLMKIYGYVAKTGDTATIIANALIAKINANPESIVVATAVGSTTGISLTAKSFGTSFKIAVGGNLQYATIVGADEAIVGVSTAAVLGEGTPDQIKALEDLAMTERGKTNRLWLAQQWTSITSLVLAGSTYKQYVFKYHSKNDIGGFSKNEGQAQEIVLACEMTGSATDGDGTGGTVVQTQTINTIMTALFANVGTAAQANETGA